MKFFNFALIACAALPLTAMSADVEYHGKNISGLDNVIATTSSTTTNAWHSVVKDTLERNFLEYEVYSLLTHNHAGKVSHQESFDSLEYDVEVKDIGLSQGANDTGRTATVAIAVNKHERVLYYTKTRSPYNLKMPISYDSAFGSHSHVPSYHYEYQDNGGEKKVFFHAVNAQTENVTVSMWRINDPYQDELYAVKLSILNNDEAYFSLPPLMPERLLNKALPFIKDENAQSSVRIDNLKLLETTETTGNGLRTFEASGRAVVSFGLKSNPNYGLRCTTDFEMKIDGSDYDVYQPLGDWSCAIKNNINN